MKTKIAQENPKPEEFGSLRGRVFNGGRVEMYGADVYGGRGDYFHSITLFPKEKGVSIEYDKDRPPEEMYDSQGNMRDICNKETREIIKFNQEKGITQEFSADYHGPRDEDKSYPPTEIRSRASYLRKILSSHLLPNFKSQLNSSKYSINGIYTTKKNENDERRLVETYGFRPFLLPPVTEEGYKRILLEITSAQLHRGSSYLVPWKLVKLELALKGLEELNGRHIPSYEIHNRWDEFLQEFDVKEPDFKEVDFEKSQYTLKEELTQELMGGKVIGMVVGPDKEISDLESTVDALLKTLNGN